MVIEIQYTQTISWNRTKPKDLLKGASRRLRWDLKGIIKLNKIRRRTLTFYRGTKQMLTGHPLACFWGNPLGNVSRGYSLPSAN